MYNYNYDYYYKYDSSAFSIFSGAFLVIWIITLLISIFNIICLWKVFTKAGKPGWAAIVPIYNIIVLLEITELPMWYIVLFFIPIANIVALFLIYIELAHRFGKSTGFGVGLVFLSPVFMALLAFDKNAVYQGNVNTQNNYNQQQYTNYNNGYNQQQYSNYNNGYNQQQYTNYNNGYNQQTNSSYNQSQTNSSFCPNCGTKLEPNQKFCNTCGNKIM